MRPRSRTATAMIGPSVMRGEAATATPALLPRAKVSATTSANNGPGESPPLSPKTAAAKRFSIIDRVYAGKWRLLSSPLDLHLFHEIASPALLRMLN